MKRIVWLSFAVLAVCVLQGAGGARAGGADVVLFDAPRGEWLATVRASAALVVVEERAGWRKVKIEGWVAGAGEDSATTPAPLPGHMDGGAVVRGVLLPTAMQRDNSPGAGLIVLLVSDLDRLDAEHAQAGAICKADVKQADTRLETARAQLDAALNSSENFREAAARHDGAKAALNEAEAARAERVAACHRSAEAIFQRFAVQRAISDDAGRFEFTGVAPGRYRVVATEIGGDRAWSMECPVGGEPTVIVDPRRDASGIDPFWGVR